MSFVSQKNRPFKNADVQIIGKFIQENFPSGQFTAKDFVELSRDKDAPTHKYFDWDDKSAAEKYRLRQAKTMISCVEIISNEKQIRAFHHVQINSKKSAFVATEICQQSRRLWDQVVEQAMREIELWALRYQNYKQLSPIFDSIQNTKSELSTEITP